MATGTWIYEKGSVTGGGGGTGGGGVPAPPVDIIGSADVIFRSDHRVEVAIDWSSAATATAANFRGVAIYLEDPDISTGANHPLNGLDMPLDGTAQVSGEWAPILVNESVKSPAIIFLDSTMGSTFGQTYKDGRDVRIYLAAYGPYSHPHLVRATDTTETPTPNLMVYIPKGRDQGESGQEWAFLVTLPPDAVTVVTDYNRLVPKYSLTLKYTPPDPSIPVPPGINHFGGCRIVFVYENDSGDPMFPGSDTGMTIPVAQADSGFKSDNYEPSPAGGKFRVYFCSEDDSQPVGSHINSLVEGTTPWAYAVIPPVAPTPDVSEFTIANQKVVWLMDGSMVAQAVFSWHLPDISAGKIRYAGVYLYLVSVSGTATKLTAFPQDLTGPHSNVETNYLMEISNIPGTTEDWIIAAISYSNNGDLADQPKDYGKPNFHSPTVTWRIGPPTPGSPGSGEEFAPLITLGAGAAATDTQSLSSDGVNMVSFSVGPWVNPTDNKFGNAQIGLVVNSDWSKPTYYTVPANATSFQTPPFPSFGNIGSAVSVEFYLVSDDPQGNKNSIVPGKTPKIPFSYTPKAGAIIPARSGWFDESQFDWVDGEGLTATRIEATAVYVGKTLVVGGATDTSFAGQYNGQIAVKNSSGTLRAWMGEQQSDQGMTGGVPPKYGGWFAQVWVGGSSPLDAPLWVDDQGIIQVGGIAARAGARFPYLSIRDQTGLEQGRIGASINAPSGSVGDNVGIGPPAQLTAGAWFSQLAVGGSNLSNWNMLIVPDTSKPLGSKFLMRNIYQLQIDYAAQQGPPSNPEYVLEFGNNVWSAAAGATQWQFPGIHIYNIDKVPGNPSGQNLFGAVYLNRGMVLRGTQKQGYHVLAALVTYNGQDSGSDEPGDFWGELTLYSPLSAYQPTVSLSSGAMNEGNPQFKLLDKNGNVLFHVDRKGAVYITGPLQGILTGGGAATPVNAYAYNVGGYPGVPAKPVISADGSWVGNTIPAPPPIGQSPWTTDIEGSQHKLSGVSTVSAKQFAKGDGTIVIDSNGTFIGPDVDVGLNHHVYGSYIATNQYLDGNRNILGANQIDTGTLNCKTVNCHDFNAASFNPASMSVTGIVHAGDHFDGGRFEGSGVWCPDYGIRCGSITVANAAGAGQTISCGSIVVGTITNPDKTTTSINCVKLAISGTERIDINGIYRGGVQGTDHVYGANFGITAVSKGVSETGATGFYDRDGGYHIVRGGIITET